MLIIVLDSGQGRPWALVKSFFCFFLHKKAPPFGGASCCARAGYTRCAIWWSSASDCAMMRASIRRSYSSACESVAARSSSSQRASCTCASAKSATPFRSSMSPSLRRAGLMSRTHSRNTRREAVMRAAEEEETGFVVMG